KFLLENEAIKSVTTEETGMFFADLPVGVYDIEISKEEYNVTTAKGFRLEADRVYTLPTNLTLRKPNPVYQQLPEELVCSDDSGNWATTIRIKSDGRFSGESYVKNQEETDVDYPEGTVYECNFNGRFLAPKEVEPGIYSVSLDHYSHGDTSGEPYIENKQRHIATAYPKGMEASIRFILYFPGTPTEKLPESLAELISRYHMEETIPANCYILYSEDDYTGFVGIAK
ncbi:MAG: carboxypeptidase regulatory-like domain-containing protein, partial [Clostridia bacterium]|nr:carboxypeptidase regulatory-like domain-containing protein [Clostridia bacterium]